MQQTPVRVLVVDDQRPFRAAAELRPDLVLMDVCLPGIDGVAAAGRIHAETPASVVVLCSSYAREDLSISLEEPGVAGYLHKEELHGPALRELWARISP